MMKKFFYLFEVLIPSHGTFFSVQWSFLYVGRTFLKIVIWCWKVFLDLKQHVNDG